MSRSRYLKIKENFHLADNQNLEPGFKIAKVKPIYDAFNQSLIRFGVLHNKLSIDESMIPYKGLHSIRQYMKSKPIKFGYKAWAICGEDGYPYHLQIYCGKSSEKLDFGLGGSVVVRLIDEMYKIGDEDIKNCEYFFDNFFSSHDLLSDLTGKEILATGTIRENRTGGADKVLLSKKLLQKKDRGSYDFVCNESLFITSWNDNSVCQVISNCHQIDPIRNTQRWKKGKGQIYVEQPHVIKAYNEGMGGVDAMDRLLESYRPSVNMKKWWWSLFINVLNLSVIASWRLYQKANPDSKMTHLEFRRYVTQVLVKSNCENQVKKSVVIAVPPKEVRLDGVGHFVETTSQGRCCVCKKNTRKVCVKCKKRLHSDRQTNCFYEYHNNSHI